MSRYSLTGNLRDAAFQKGADLFGVADVSCFLDPSYTGNRPQDIMPEVSSVILLGVSVPRGAFHTLPLGRGEYTNTLMAGTATLRVIAFSLARQVEKAGYLATIVPTEGSEFGYWYADRSTLKADLSLKYAAYHAGLGSFGLNHLLIHPDFGARVRMTGILTDAPLEAGKACPGGFFHSRCAKMRNVRGSLSGTRHCTGRYNQQGGLRRLHVPRTGGPAVRDVHKSMPALTG